MQIHFHSHHAEVSESMRRRAEREVARAAERVPRAVEAVIRFEQDGPISKVTLALRAPRHHDLLGQGEGRNFGPALSSAVSRVIAQATKEKRVLAKSRAHRDARLKS